MKNVESCKMYEFQCTCPFNADASDFLKIRIILKDNGWFEGSATFNSGCSRPVFGLYVPERKIFECWQYVSDKTIEPFIIRIVSEEIQQGNELNAKYSTIDNKIGEVIMGNIVLTVVELSEGTEELSLQTEDIDNAIKGLILSFLSMDKDVITVILSVLSMDAEVIATILGFLRKFDK